MKHPWDAQSYHNIQSVERKDQHVLVTFQNGDDANVPEKTLVEPDPVPDHWTVTRNPEVIAFTIRSGDYELEVPWDVVRSYSDPEFAVFLRDTERQHREYMGACIRSYRKQRKLTGRKLAEAAGIHWVTLSRIENGQSSVSFETLNKLMPVLGVTMHDFVREDDGREIPLLPISA